MLKVDGEGRVNDGAGASPPPPPEGTQNVPAKTSAPPGRLRRALRGIGAGLGLTTVFVLSAVTGALIHLDTGAARRAARTITNDALGSLFLGKIVIGEIDHLSVLDGVVVRSATILDPRGKEIIRASGVRAETSALAIAKSFVFGGDDAIQIRIPIIRVADAVVLMDEAPNGDLTLAEAFTPKPDDKPKKPKKEPTGPEREVVVDLSNIGIEHAWIHGYLAPPQALDAEVSHLSGSLRSDNAGVTLDLERTDVIERALAPAHIAGTAGYHLRITAPGALADPSDVVEKPEPERITEGSKPEETTGQVVTKMWADYNGKFGDIEVIAKFLMEDDRIEATADVPRATPAAIQKIVPGVPIQKPLSVRASAEGHLPKLELAASVRIEDGEEKPGAVDVNGSLFAGDVLRIVASVDAQRIDPRLFGDDLPAAKANALADVELEVGDRLRAVAFARTDALEIAGQPVPALDVHAVVDGEDVSGTVHAHEEGMPLDASFALIPEGVRFEASTSVANLRAVPRIAAPVDGSVRLSVSGTVKGSELDARVRASASGVRAPGDVELDGAQITGHVHGPFEALKVNASIDGQGLRAGGYSFDTLNVDASGPVTAPRVSASLRNSGGDVVSASATVDAEGAGARQIKVHVEKDGQKLDGKVARVSAAGGRIAIDGIDFKGDALEGLNGSIAIRGDDITGKLHAESVDLARVVKLAGLPLRARGVASVDLAIDRTAKGHKGHVNLALEGGEMSLLSGVSSMMSVSLMDDKVSADGFVRLVARPPAGERAGESEAGCCSGNIAEVRISGSGDRARGPLLSPKTWAGVAGTLQVAATDLDLGCLAQLAPDAVPLSEILGKLSAKVTVARAAGQRFASIRDFSIRTRGLQVAGPRAYGAEAPDWESRSIDFQVQGAVDSEAGRVDAALTLFDPGLLADLRASINIDVPALIAAPGRAMALLQKAPIAAHFTIPRRKVGSFSSIPMVKKGAIPLEGEVGLDVYAAGSIQKPVVVARAMGFGLAHVDALAAANEEGDFRLPVDLDTLITYDSEKGTFEAHIKKDEKEIITANAEVTARLEDLLAGKPKDPKRKLFKGGFEAKLHDVPLGEIPFLADSNIGGHIDGRIAIQGIGDEPRVAIDLEMPDLQVGESLFFESGRISLHIDPTKDVDAAAVRGVPGMPAPTLTSPNTGVANVELVAQDGGRLSLTGFAGITWQDGVVPLPDKKAAADIILQARQFRLMALEPFLAGALSQLDGYLNGDARVSLNLTDAGLKPRLEADMALTGGVFHVPQLGQEFREARVRIIANPAGVLRFDDIYAKALTGDIEGWALARMNMKDLTLEAAGAELRIGQGEALPFALEGVPLGNIRGRVMVTAGMKDKALTVNVRVPEINLELPSSIGRSVQGMDDHQEVVVRQPLGPEKEETRDEDAMKIVLNLGVDRANIEGSIFSLALRTSKQVPMRVELTDKARIFGDIQLLRGEFELLGKRFELERGLVHMRGTDDPNPYLNVSVRWDAPDGSQVFIEYVGDLDPIVDEKIRFRSDPPRSKQEIIRTLLLGSEYEDGTLAGGGQGGAEQKGPTRSTGNAAGGMAAGFIADQFSNLFADSGIKTSLGTSESGALKTGLAYESGTTRTQITYEGAGNSTGTRGSPGGLGLGGGSTEVSVDWRFLRNWLVRGMVRVGEDQPSSGVDVLWQYRY
jgi:translocation and assembly module TamB